VVFTPLIYASANGALETVSLLLELFSVNPQWFNSSINYRDNKQGMTPLHYALINKHEEIVKNLVEQGANLNLPDFQGRFPLHLSIQVGCNPEITEFLLNNGSNVNSPDFEGVLPIHYASTIGNVRICKSLIDYGGFVNAQDIHGETPLFYAVRESRFDVVRALIQNFGANPHLKNEDNESVMDLCTEIGDLEMMNLLDSLITGKQNQQNNNPINRFYYSTNDTTMVTQQNNGSSMMEVEIDFNNSGCCGNSSMKFSGSTSFIHLKHL